MLNEAGAFATLDLLMLYGTVRIFTRILGKMAITLVRGTAAQSSQVGALQSNLTLEPATMPITNQGVT